MKGNLIAATWALFVLSAAANAAVDSYIRFEPDAKLSPVGLSLNKGFLAPTSAGPLAADGWFDIKAFSIPIENKATIGSATGGAGAGKVTFNPFSITIPAGSLDATLFRACCAGAHFKKVEIAMRKAGGSADVKAAPFFQVYTFTTVFVSSINWAASSGDDGPVESITFSYGGLALQYSGGGKPQISGWDRLTNAPITTAVAEKTP